MTAHTLDEYKKLALELFRLKLGSDVESVDVREDYDFKDDEALFFEIFLTQTAPDDIGRNFMSSHLLLRKELEKLGEIRFPYVSTRRPASGQHIEDMIIKSDRTNESQSLGRSTR